jgi:hypothetical protein
MDSSFLPSSLPSVAGQARVLGKFVEINSPDTYPVNKFTGYGK